MLSLKFPTFFNKPKAGNIILLIALILIFIRPFVSSLAFPYLNLILSQGFLLISGVYIINKKPPFLKLSPLTYPVILFILALSISIVFSQDKINSLSEVYKYISGLFLFLAAVSLSERQERLIIRTITLAALAVSMLAIYQYFFGFRHLSNYLSGNKLLSPFVLDYLQSKRVFSPFVTPGILGGYLAMIVPLFLINKKRLWLMLPVIFALFLTKSLAAIFSLFVGLIIYFSLRGRLKNKGIFYLLGTFIFILIIFFLRYATGREHTQPSFSMAMRLSYWKGALEIIGAHPLAGVGPGNFNLSTSRYAHNSYLQIWAELGIFGLLSLIWLGCNVLGASLKNLSQSFKKDQTICLFTAGVIFLIHNLLDFTFFLPEVTFIWWIILGLVAASNFRQPQA